MAARNGVGPILQSPLTWLALLVCGLFVWSIWKWFEPPWVMLLLSIALAVFVFCLWPLFYMRSEAYVRAAFGLGKRAEGNEARSVNRLVEDFQTLCFREGVEQVRMLRQKYHNLADVLRRRLDAGELT